MRKVQGLAALVLALASTTPTLAESFRSRSHTTGFSLPGVHAPSGNDEVRAADGTTCKSSLGHRGAYVDVGGVASESDGGFGDAAVYGRVIIPLGRKPSRIDCTRLYELEMERLRMEVDAMRRSIAAGGSPIGRGGAAVSVSVQAASAEAEFDRAFGYEGYPQSAKAAPVSAPSGETVASIAPTVPPREVNVAASTASAPGNPSGPMDPSGRFDVPTASGAATVAAAIPVGGSMVGDLDERWLLPFGGPVPKFRPAVLQARSVAVESAPMVPPALDVRRDAVAEEAPPVATVEATTAEVTTVEEARPPAAVQEVRATVPARPLAEAAPPSPTFDYERPEPIYVPTPVSASPVPDLPKGSLEGYDRKGKTASDVDPYEWPFSSSAAPNVDPQVTNAVTVNQTTLSDLEVIAQTRAASLGLPIDRGNGWADAMFSAPAR